MPTNLVDYSTLKSNIFVAIYYPPRWRTLAIMFDFHHNGRCECLREELRYLARHCCVVG
jgi:hypothetical protein